MKFIKDNAVKFFASFLIIFFAGLVSYFILHFGYYPVAVVNYQIITAKSFNDIYASALHYYEVLVERNGESRENLNKEGFRIELRRQVLNQLIEQQLMSAGLKEIAGSKTKQLLAEKLNIPNLETEEFKSSVEALYNLTMPEFKEMILIPQAYREILTGQLGSEKKDFGGWLSEAKRSANVTLLFSGFSWQNGELVARD